MLTLKGTDQRYPSVPLYLFSSSYIAFFSTSSFLLKLYWFRVCFPGKWSPVLSVNTDASVWVLSFLDSFVCNQPHTILSSQDCGLSCQKFPGPSYLPFSLNPCACLFSSFVHVACLHSNLLCPFVLCLYLPAQTMFVHLQSTFVIPPRRFASRTAGGVFMCPT